MQHMIIGVDSYKLSATIEVIGEPEQLRGLVRFGIDRVGYAAIIDKLVPDPARFAGSSVPAEAGLPDAKGDCF